MSTPTRQVVYTPVDMDDAEFSEYVDPKMAQENEEFETFKSEMHDAQFDAKITVGKKLTDSSGRPLGRQVFECFECGIDDYTFSQLCTRIREDFGTGLYKIQGRDSNGKFKFDKTVGILAPGTPDNAPANDVGALIDKMSDAMQRQQMATEQMFSKLVGPQSGGDAFDQMTKMMTAMGGMMGAMGVTPQQAAAPKTLVEQLTEFKMIKELFGHEGDGELGGDANIYSLLGKTMDALGGPIAAALAAGTESGELNPQGLLENKNPQISPALVDAEQSRKEKMVEQEKHDMAMRKNIHILIQNAKTKIPPEMFANILVNNTPEEKQDELWEFISAENCVDTLIQLEPAAEPHRKWFDDLRLAVIELMAEPDAKFEQFKEKNIESHIFAKDVNSSRCFICDLSKSDGNHLQNNLGKKSGLKTDIDDCMEKELQHADSASNLLESEHVAGVEDKDSTTDASDASKSDSHTKRDT